MFKFIIKSMPFFSDYFLSLDSFGEPVSVNYKSDTTYKTVLGALLTIALKIFVLVYGVQSVIGMASFEDPSIVQYVTYEKRQSSKAFNAAEFQL